MIKYVTKMLQNTLYRRQSVINTIFSSDLSKDNDTVHLMDPTLQLRKGYEFDESLL